MTVDKLSIFDGEKKQGQRELPRVELTKELLDSVRHIEGFPIGTDEDIIRLSDPPYYTACPNPFIGEFIKKYGKPYDPETDTYHREPFAADVSEGKNDPIYNAHSYHTKVPHKAIMRYILHYTEPGDIVFDGFCGTGMTGVAAQLCNDRNAVESLGYKVKSDGTIVEEQPGDDKPASKLFSKLGIRRSILSDLSPAATFIAHNYNKPIDPLCFETAARSVLSEIDAEFSWMYATLRNEYVHEAHIYAERVKRAKTSEDIRAIIADGGPRFSRTSSTIRSDVLICPMCSKEIIFWYAAVDNATGKVHPSFNCSNCKSMLQKRQVDKSWIRKHDSSLGREVQHVKQVPVLIYYERQSKKPDAFDMALLEFIEQMRLPIWWPADRMPVGDESRRNDPSGLTHLHHFYTDRNLFTLALFRSKAADNSLLFPLTGVAVSTTKMYRYTPNYEGGGPLTGTLYVPSILREINAMDALDRFINKLIRFRKIHRPTTDGAIVSTGSTTSTNLPDSSVQYIFTDPPFGGNIMYSELNYLWESWLRVATNNVSEAIENKAQRKRAEDYQELMESCFREYYRVLQPGRWMTVEFHNSQNRVWNLIQEAILRAGFVIANVATLDKKQGTFKQLTSAGAVKQDLVITAYKPTTKMEIDFNLKAGTEEGVWDFVRNHLTRAPSPTFEAGVLEPTPERKNFLLFDRMVAYHIQRGATVPISASQFYVGLHQRFVERDGMYFLPEQANIYDKARAQVRKLQQLSIFVTDEKSAILWVRGELEQRPQTFGELQPNFMKNGQPQRHEKMPDLQKILEQSFLKDDQGRWYVPDSSRQADLEKMREKELLREFEEYRSSKGKLRVFRTEAVRAGFKQAWAARDFATIVSVAKKIPEAVLQEDSALLMYYDNARTRLED